MKPTLDNEEMAGAAIVGIMFTLVLGALGLGIGLIFLGFLQAVGLSLVVAVIAFFYFTRKTARALLKAKQDKCQAG
jgi:membrane protein implicated in regulation of membrane protease activity